MLGSVFGQSNSWEKENNCAVFSLDFHHARDIENTKMGAIATGSKEKQAEANTFEKERAGRKIKSPFLALNRDNKKHTHCVSSLY